MPSRPSLVALPLAVALAACGAPGEPTAPPVASLTAPSAPSPDQTPDAAAPAEEEGPGVIDLTVRDGEVSGADRRVTIPLGTAVTLTVTSDAADVIHVHGYDLHQDVPAGGSAELAFTADIPGVFEVELEDTGVRLVELEVR